MTTLLVTNDFGPRIGGIETFCRSVCASLDNDVVVFTADQPGARTFDRSLDFPVVRRPGPLLPTPSTARQAISLLRAYSCDKVVFGAAAPLGLLASRLRRAGADRIMALSHGHEVWWARTMGTSRLLRRIGDTVDVFSTISNHTRSWIEPCLSPSGRRRLVRLPPPVDAGFFTAEPSHRDDTVCVAAGRFVPQKGFAALLRAWGMLTESLGPGYALRLIGDGPQLPALRRAAARLRYPDTVQFTGSVPHRDLPSHLASAAVFALPVRSLLRGRYAEGLGVVFLEAAASGLPVVVGRSGGAVETVRSGQTGTIVDPERPAEIATAIADLLTDPDRARSWGSAGRLRVAQEYSGGVHRRRLRSVLGIGGEDADEILGLGEDRRSIPVEGGDVVTAGEDSFHGSR